MQGCTVYLALCTQNNELDEDSEGYLFPVIPAKALCQRKCNLVPAVDPRPSGDEVYEYL